MMGGESGRDPNEEDSRLESLKERLRQADQDEAVRTGSTQKGVDQGYRLGNRVMAELVGGIAGGALIGWFFVWLFSTSPWLLLFFLFLGIFVAFRNIIRISNEITHSEESRAGNEDVITCDYRWWPSIEKIYKMDNR